MAWLFLKFHLKLCVALMVAGSLAYALILPPISRRVNNNFEDFLAGPMTLMAEAIRDERARSPGPSRLLARTAERFRSPVALLSRQQDLGLLHALLQRLDRGEVVCERDAGPFATLYIAIAGTDEVLRLGPLRPKNPLGQGRGIGVALLFFLGLSVGIYLLVYPLRKNLQALAQAAECFSRGQLTTRAEVRSRDAIGDLAGAFNRMAEEIQRLMATQRELLQMVSHELRAPLQRIHFAAAILRETSDDSQRESALTRMERDLLAFDELLDELLHYIRLERDIPLRLQPVELAQLIAERVEIQQEGSVGVSISVAANSSHPIAQVDPRLLRRALSNLIGNALRHARSRVEITAMQRGSVVQLDVDDDGPGVPPADRQRIFEPFQQLAQGREHAPRGYGLGLAIVRRIADRHGGTVAVDSSPLGGARFRMSIPISARTRPLTGSSRRSKNSSAQDR